MGRARLGKSFFISILCENGEVYVNIFCSGGGAKTACPVVNIFVDAEFDEYIEFHSNFNKIYEAEENNDELQKLKDEVSKYVNEQYKFKEKTPEELASTVKEIEDLVRRMKRTS